MPEAIVTHTVDELGPLKAERRRLEAALQLAERERQLLGYEIHDGVIQDLTAAAMLLEGAATQATFASTAASNSFSHGLRLLRDSIAEARRLIRGAMAVEMDDLGLTAALQRLAERFRNDHGLLVTVDCDVGSISLPISVRHSLVRIAQEALHNVWKHARATEVELRLSLCGDQLELVISDNGVGFDPAVIPAGHFGLDSIRERARLLDADLLFDTAPEHGTRVVVRLTVPPAL